MFKVLRMIVLGVAAVAAAISSAGAASPFDAKAFMDSQLAGKTILIEVTAPWCPVCKKQRPTLDSVQKERANLVVYQVDFDTSKDVLRRFNVQKQSTLILFKGTTEVARLSYDSDPVNIRALIAKGFP